MLKLQKHSRRLFLGHAARLMVAGAVLPLAKPALASLPNARALEFDHTHTGERLSVVFAVGDPLCPQRAETASIFSCATITPARSAASTRSCSTCFSRSNRNLPASSLSRSFPATAAPTPIPGCVTRVVAVWQSRACTCWARRSTSALPACRLTICAMPPSHWVSAVSASTRGANSFISTPAGFAPGNLARPFGGWLRPRPA
jgi:hypothetical protein